MKLIIVGYYFELADTVTVFTGTAYPPIQGVKFKVLTNLFENRYNDFCLLDPFLNILMSVLQHTKIVYSNRAD